MFLQHHLLSFLIWLPVVGAAAVLMTGGDNHAKYARAIAASVAAINLLLCIPLYLGFDSGSYAMQFTQRNLWVTAYKIYYAVGVDGISLAMIILTNFTGLIVILAACEAIKVRIAQYMAAFLVMQGMMIGVFAATDAILFYVFWEGMLIPMYLSIGMWGSENRSYASIKFFLYTFLGSILMLVALLYLYTQTGTFEIIKYYGLNLPLLMQELLFWAFFLAFAVKVPMWPVHTWLPDAHTEAPSGGSVILAALMLKLGIYGFLRFSMPVTPSACQHLDWFMIALSLIAIVYIGLVAIVQSDMKKLIAYSSIAHMGFATLGCFMIYSIVQKTGNIENAYLSLEGAVIQMISHAFGSGAMFLGIGFMADRYFSHSRLIKDYGGIANRMPIFAAFFMLFAMSNIGLPGTAGFVGEFMVIMSAFQAHFWIAVTAAMTLVLAASYSLWMYKRVFFGPIANPEVAKMQDLSWLEITNYTLLAVGVLGLGIYPNPALNLLHSSVSHLLDISLAGMVAS
jgi:NADH-quinone oxidoreductase subunit M